MNAHLERVTCEYYSGNPAALARLKVKYLTFEAKSLSPFRTA
jgi:hypothetical protein